MHGLRFDRVGKNDEHKKDTLSVRLRRHWEQIAEVPLRVSIWQQCKRGEKVVLAVGEAPRQCDRKALVHQWHKMEFRFVYDGCMNSGHGVSICIVFASMFHRRLLVSFLCCGCDARNGSSYLAGATPQGCLSGSSGN